MNPNLDDFRLPDPAQHSVPTPASPNRRKRGFIRGPLPLEWFGKILQLNGKGPLVVALAIWYRAGIEKRSTELQLTRKLWKTFGICRQTAANALRTLESAGLIVVIRRPGCSPRVTILDSSSE